MHNVFASSRALAWSALLAPTLGLSACSATTPDPPHDAGLDAPVVDLDARSDDDAEALDAGADARRDARTDAGDTGISPSNPRCGGFAAVTCPGHGSCVDSPYDDCDPADGGADCTGVCVCDRTVDCDGGATFNDDPTLCACVVGSGGGTDAGSDAEPRIACGKTTCSTDQVCCSASCGICGRVGDVCSGRACDDTP